MLSIHWLRRMTVRVSAGDIPFYERTGTKSSKSLDLAEYLFMMEFCIMNRLFGGSHSFFLFTVYNTTSILRILTENNLFNNKVLHPVKDLCLTTF